MLLVRRERHPLAIQILPLDKSGCISASEIRAAIASVVSDADSNAKPRYRQDLTHTPLISVVIPTCDSDSTLVRCIRSVLSSDYENFEVIVVDNRPKSTATRAALTTHFADDARVKYADEARPGSSYARNKGLSLAEGEIVAFADDDTVVDSGWLHAIAVAFTPEVSCVTGLILPLTIDTPEQALFEQFAGFGKGLEDRSFLLDDNHNDPLFPYAAGTFGSGANTALRKSVALKLGGFDGRLGAGTPACGGEELDIYIRLLLAGEEIVYSPSAVLFHEHPSDDRGLRRRVFNYGVGLTAMLTKQMVTGPRIPLLRATPAGVRYLLDSRSRKNASRDRDYPRMLTVFERLGMLAGPLAFAFSARRAKAAPPDPDSSDMPFLPATMSTIELDHELVEVKLGRSSENCDYGSLCALVRLHGDPLAMVEIPAAEGRVSADALADAIWASAHEDLDRHVRMHGCIKPAVVTRDALTGGFPAESGCPSPLNDEIDLPFVSVIVPTSKRPERIQTCLEGLRKLQYPHFEILIVDNAPDDRRTRAVVEAHAQDDPRVHYVAEPLPGSSVARNRGVREADGDILAFTDDDVLVDAKWLKSIVEPFLKDPRIDVVTGLVLPARFDTPDQRWFEEFSGFGKGFKHKVFDLDENRADEHLFYPYWGGVFGSGNNMAFRPSLLKAISGFDPALGAGSRALAGADIESFTHAIIFGSRLAYEPRAVCWHDHRSDAAAIDKQMFNYGVGLTAILTKWLLRDPRLAIAIVMHFIRVIVSRLSIAEASRKMPHELTRLGTQLQMNRRRNTLGLQVRGYCLGPLFYWRSVRWAKRLRLYNVLTSPLSSDE